MLKVLLTVQLLFQKELMKKEQHSIVFMHHVPNITYENNNKKSMSTKKHILNRIKYLTGDLIFTVINSFVKLNIIEKGITEIDCGSNSLSMIYDESVY